jgi:CO/xanthine dehydrogenase Mo-binding subunit
MKEEYSVIGRSVPKIDGRAKATGQAKYTGDLKFQTCTERSSPARTPMQGSWA